MPCSGLGLGLKNSPLCPSTSEKHGHHPHPCQEACQDRISPGTISQSAFFLNCFFTVFHHIQRTKDNAGLFPCVPGWRFLASQHRSLLSFTVLGFTLPWKTIIRWIISFSLLKVVEGTFAVFPGKTDLQSFASGYWARALQASDPPGTIWLLPRRHTAGGLRFLHTAY